MARTKVAEESKKDKLSFLTDFNSATKGMAGVSTSAPPPKYWLDTGNYTTNKILSGTYNKGYASGRAACLAGPSGAGKSFLVGNAIKSALTPTDVEWGTLVVDSENALDEDYLTKIGADVVGNPLYNYRGVATISHTLNVVSKFIRAYKDADSEMPFLIAVDSLDQLMTDSEYEAYEKKGEMSGDMGQHARQIKAMLKRFVNDIKGTNIVLLCVKQVYQEQDKIAALQNPWRLTESTRFAFSQIGMVTKLAFKKDKSSSIFDGITLKLKGDKTRFTKPFQQCRIDVPYDAGIDRYSGILDAAVSLDIVEENGSWFNYKGHKFQKSGFSEHKEEIFQQVLAKDNAILNVSISEDEDLSEAITAKEAEAFRRSRGEFDSDINNEKDLSS